MAEARKISMASYVRLVRTNRNFRRLWFAQIISELGDWFYVISLYTMMLEFTGRAQTVGFAFLLQVMPTALVGPLAGIVNDRLRRKRVMIFTDVARATIIACMLLVRSPGMIWLAYPLLVLETVMWGLFEPARNSIIPNIVEKDEVIIANTLASTTWSMNLFLGGALGGLMAAFLGRNFVFIFDACSFLVSAVLISGMSFAEPHSEKHPPLRFKDFLDYSPLAEGFRYVRSQPGLGITVFAKAGLAVTGASWVLFTVMGARVFPVTGPGISVERGAVLGMSLLMGARGLGALIGPLLAAPWAQQRQDRLRLAIFAGFLFYGTGYVMLTWIPSAWMAYIVVSLSHMGGAMIWVFSTTLLQLMTDDKFRGRVFSADLGFCTLMLGLSAIIAGTVMDHGVTVRMVCFGMGVFTLLAGALWGMFGTRVRAVEPIIAKAEA